MRTSTNKTARSTRRTGADVNVDYSIHMDLAHDIIKLLIDTNVKVTLASGLICSVVHESCR